MVNCPLMNKRETFMRQACKQIMCMVWFYILFLGLAGLAVPFAQADIVFEEHFESGGVELG